MSETVSTSDVYALVTNQIIQQLEQGNVPWQKPWADAGLPQNLLTHRPYRGINVWLLASLGYPQNYFLTWKQLKSIGASVKKEEKAHLVVFWKTMEKEEKQDTHDENSKVKRVLRYYWVFNIGQCTGIAEHLIFPFTKPVMPIDACEDILTAMPQRPPIVHEKQQAFYDMIEDSINMPKLKSFINVESYYATLFHELIHSTGHTTRLNRKELNEMTEFGSKPYSIEELTAEIGSCYLSSQAGIVTTFTNSVAYIEGWLQKLQQDKRFIFYGSTQAQKAVDFILNTQVEQSE